MDTAWKNRLQEYCQENNFALTNYQIKEKSGLLHVPKFLAEVEVNGRWYVSNDSYPTKKTAEQSAAENAWRTLVERNSNSIPPSPFSHHSGRQTNPSSSLIERHTIEHLPIKYAYIEQFIGDMIRESDGRIENIWSLDARGRYKFEITGSYHYCENVKKDHKENQIYFLVNPMKQIYYQKCFGFRSTRKSIGHQEENNIFRKCRGCRKQMKCKKLKIRDFCKKNFCRKCDISDSTIICKQCFDCHAQ